MRSGGSSKGPLILVGVAMAWCLLACRRPGETLSAGQSVDRIVVIKGERRLYLMDGERVIKAYRIALGKNPTGHKSCEGDNKTPEGPYTIDWKSEKSIFPTPTGEIWLPPRGSDALRAGIS
jgi:hypothetical protein